MDRRSFLKIAGISAAAGGLTLTGCKQEKKEATEGMTYRVHPENGDKVSILGYGFRLIPQHSRLRADDTPHARRLFCKLTRLRSHIEQFRSIAEEGIVGRKLDFLVQEFNREANTTCSKSNDVTITRAGLALKNEIEKIREQVQNLE